MSLRARLTLAFALVSLTSLAGLAALSWSAVSRPFEATADVALDGMASAVEFEFRRTGTGLDARIDHLADEVVRASRARGSDLLTAAADGHSGALVELQELIEERAAASGMEFLKVVRDDGVVLAAHPYSVTALSPFFADPDAVTRARTGTPPSARYEKVPPESGDAALAQVPLIVAARTLGNGRTVLVGGTFLDEDYVERVAALCKGRAMLLGPDGVRIAAPEMTDTERTRVSHRLRGHDRGVRVALGGAQWRLAALPLSLEPDDASARMPEPSDTRLWLVIGISDAGLVAARNRIAGAFIGLGIFFGLASFLAGTVLSRRFSAPVEDLVTGAAAIASGDLDHRVPARKGAAEIDRLIQAFNKMAADLEHSHDQLARTERIAAWREIARMIAHEIKNPLTPIQLAMETAQRARREKRDDFDEIFAESTAAVLEEVDRLRTLVAGFSDFARMPAPAPAPADINELVRSTVGLFTGLPENVNLTTSLGPDLPAVELDADQFSRALLNLLTNAAEALRDAGRGGHIEVTTSIEKIESEPYVVCTVSDDGPGMSAETREQLFVPYFTTKSDGTGLGLAIVHRIVTDHGGRVEVTSEPGKGSQFRLYWTAHARSGSGFATPS